MGIGHLVNLYIITFSNNDYMFQIYNPPCAGAIACSQVNHLGGGGVWIAGRCGGHLQHLRSAGICILHSNGPRHRTDMCL